MKRSGVLVLLLCAIASCGGGEKSSTKRAIASQAGNMNEQKVQCVAQGGFLVPNGAGFACKLENGQTVGLHQL